MPRCAGWRSTSSPGGMPAPVTPPGPRAYGVGYDDRSQRRHDPPPRRPGDGSVEAGAGVEARDRRRRRRHLAGAALETAGWAAAHAALRPAIDFEKAMDKVGSVETYRRRRRRTCLLPAREVRRSGHGDPRDAVGHRYSTMPGSR
jgi:hypothetical protein